jgi:hypothetical protein
MEIYLEEKLRRNNFKGKERSKRKRRGMERRSLIV